MWGCRPDAARHALPVAHCCWPRNTLSCQRWALPLHHPNPNPSPTIQPLPWARPHLEGDALHLDDRQQVGVEHHHAAEHIQLALGGGGKYSSAAA